MAETNGNGQKMQQAAESVLLQLVARWGIVGICAVALPAGAWVGTRIVSTLDRQADVLNSLTTDMAVVKNDISYLKNKVHP
jgi:hypothetical protein